MAYPPSDPRTDLTDSTPAASTHAAHHNTLAQAIIDIKTELGDALKGSGADLKARLSSIESDISQLQTDVASKATGNPTLYTEWSELGRWGLSGSESNVFIPSGSGTITEWQVGAPAANVPSQGQGTVNLKKNGTVIDTIVWSFSSGSVARETGLSLTYAADDEIIPEVTEIIGLASGDEVRNVTIRLGYVED